MNPNLSCLKIPPSRNAWGTFYALIRIAVITVLFASPSATRAAMEKEKPSGAATATAPRQLSTERKPWAGDFDGMLQRRVIRVLAPFSRTLYFNDKGRERGVGAELVRDFERHINQKYKKQLGNRPITIVLIPTPRDKLLPGLTAGLGDIAIGNLTETGERLKIVDFVAPKDRKPVFELVVTGPKTPPLASLDDLAGKTVHVRKSSSYYGSLSALNQRFAKAGKPPVKLVLVSESLEDEDMMEMLNAGLLEVIVVDDWMATMWAKVLPKIKVRQDLAVSAGGYTGWAIRKGSPQLVAEVNDFYKNSLKKAGTIEYLMAQYLKNIKQIRNNTASSEWARFEQTLGLFRKYGQQYDFDPLLLAAQGYQESRLNQNAKSHVGAVGIMQIMPATGKELAVGNIREPEPNVHGGAKYMDTLMEKYFKDAKFSEGNRALFAFASYNAGPGKIARMRKAAAERGLDPDKWFHNVEVVTAEKIGIETTTYVRNIYKYYVSYKLQEDALEEQRKAREQIAPAKK